MRTMATATRQSARKFVTGAVPDGKTFATHFVPGGTSVHVMDSGVLREALARSDVEIRKSVEKIQKSHGR
jgi:hypothetical protein